MTDEFSTTFYPRNKHKKSTLLLALIVIFIVIIGIFLIRTFKKTTTSVISPVPQESGMERMFPFLSSKKNPDELKKRIEKEIGTTWNNYSVVVKDLTSDFSLAMNDRVMYSAASINKVPILAALYYYVQKNELKLDTIVTLQPDDIQDYGTGSIRYDPPGTTYSVQTLARLMIQKSDNTAAYILGRQIIGIPKIQTLIDSWGMTQTDMENNKTSNADMELLFEKMYREKIANHALTLEMFSFLTNGEIEDRIPALLPKEAVVYHKTGNGVGVVHDVGIITGAKSRYYIGIFTSDISDEKGTAERMAKISKIVYDFMK